MEKMKGKKQRQKVIPHCYRRNLSRTLSNSSISQLVQIGAYKKRINDLSRNNNHLARALQDCRVEAAIQSNMLKDCAKDYNKVLFARLKLNEMARNLAKFVSDLEEVQNCLDVDPLSDKYPFTHKKGSPSNKVYKEPGINCIEEVTEDSSANEVSSENVAADPNPTAYRTSDKKKSDVLPRASGNNVGVINEEDMDVAPILFADDLEEKNRKSSSKSRASKMLPDPDKCSLTPELNIDVTCVKLKRKSSRRQTQVFVFPGSRSTSRGKNSSIGKDNSPEELITPVRPSSPVSTEQKQDAQSIEKIFQSSMDKNIKENLCENQHENHTKTAFDNSQFHVSNMATVNSMKNSKTVVTSDIQPVLPNLTVLFGDDMELTEVIRPVHPIIVQNAPPAANPEITKESKDNYPSETKDNVDNKEITTENDSLEQLIPYQKTQNRLNDDDLQVSELNEKDEIQNVGTLTFCEPNELENVGSRTTKSSFIGHPRRSKPVKYAIFFSSDESGEDSSFEINSLKTSASKRKTVVLNKNEKSSEKTETTVSHYKGSSNSENKLKKDNSTKHIDSLDSGKEERIVKTTKDKNNSSKKDTVASNDGNSKLNKRENVKKLVPSLENAQKSEHSQENAKNLTLNHETNKKLGYAHENSKKSMLSHDNDKKSGHAHEKVKGAMLSQDKDKRSKHNHENIKDAMFSQNNDKKSKPNHENVKETMLSHDNDKKSKHNHENVKKGMLSHDNDTKSKHNHENVKKAMLSHDNDKKSKSNHENEKRLMLSRDNDKKSRHNHENIKKLKISHDTDKKSVQTKENVKKPTLSHENDKKLIQHSPEPQGLNLENTKKTEQIHENVKSLVVFSPGFSPGGILKKTQTNIQGTKEVGNETPINKPVHIDLNDSIFDDTPKSESGKVSFAPTDLVCNFKKMSFSKKISKNKKLRRTSKSAFDLEKLHEEKTKTKSPLMSSDNCSKSTNIKKTDDAVLFDFSADTEVYSSEFLAKCNFLSGIPTDDLMLKPIASNSSKNSSKIVKNSKKVVPSLKPIKTTKKLSLKKSKDSKNSQPHLISEEALGEGSCSTFESPISIPKPAKRKSLFMDDLDNSKENINVDHQVVEKKKNILQVKGKGSTNVNSELIPQDNHLKKSTGSKRQSKAHQKKSLKKSSGKQKSVEPTSDMKKKLNVVVRSHENSPVLRDTINLPEDEVISKRRNSKQVSYREPSLNKKLRRE